MENIIIYATMCVLGGAFIYAIAVFLKELKK
jgi:hypothetical protein